MVKYGQTSHANSNTLSSAALVRRLASRILWLEGCRAEDFALPRGCTLVTDCRQNNTDREVQQPDTREEALKPRQYTTKNPNDDINDASRIVGTMGPPSQLKRTS